MSDFLDYSRTWAETVFAYSPAKLVVPEPGHVFNVAGVAISVLERNAEGIVEGTTRDGKRFLIASYSAVQSAADAGNQAAIALMHEGRDCLLHIIRATGEEAERVGTGTAGALEIVVDKWTTATGKLVADFQKVFAEFFKGGSQFPWVLVAILGGSTLTLGLLWYFTR